MPEEYENLASQLNKFLDKDPEAAVQLAKSINSNNPNYIGLRAGALIDGGASTGNQTAVKEGVDLFRKLQKKHPVPSIKYNLANGLAALVGMLSHDSTWATHQESTRIQRAEIRQLYWDVGVSSEADLELQTQALTNLANQFSNSYRLSEAHDMRLQALKIDPDNGVAAGLASKNLMWLYKLGICSETTKLEAMMLAKIAKDNPGKLRAYVGVQNAKAILGFADHLPDPPARSKHQDPFIAWVEAERLTLSPTVELVDPSLGEIDWLTLPPIQESLDDSRSSATVPAIFAMFNTLKSDFLIARDIAWQVVSNKSWPKTGSYADTLDYSVYGASISATTLAHRAALDILDKVAIVANYYFKLGQDPKRLDFSNLWREKDNGFKLRDKIKSIVDDYAPSLYGLVELSDDYRLKRGALNEQKNIRNASTHRFVVLQDMGINRTNNNVKEVKRYDLYEFNREVMNGLRLARSVIQMLALAIHQQEDKLANESEGIILAFDVPDHDYIRGQ